MLYVHYLFGQQFCCFVRLNGIGQVFLVDLLGRSGSRSYWHCNNTLGSSQSAKLGNVYETFQKVTSEGYIWITGTALLI